MRICVVVWTTRGIVRRSFPRRQRCNPGTNHEEIWELKRRISNLVAELQLAEIDKEKLRQLREAAETRRMEAEARYANAEVEVARSRAAINRIASVSRRICNARCAKESSTRNITRSFAR